MDSCYCALPPTPGRRSHFLPSEQRQRGSGLAMVVNGRKQSGVTNMWKYGARISLMLWFFSHRVSQTHTDAVFHHLRNRKGELCKVSLGWTLRVLWFQQGCRSGPTLVLKIIIIFSECDGGGSSPLEVRRAVGPLTKIQRWPGAGVDSSQSTM